MALIADILLVAGAFAAALYCMVLSRRLKQFTDLERGVGGAVAVLSAQVDDMTKALERARAAAGTSADSLEQTTIRAEGVAKRLELLIAATLDASEGSEEPRRVRRPVFNSLSRDRADTPVVMPSLRQGSRGGSGE